MNINKISSTIQTGAASVLGGVSKIKPMERLSNYFQKDPVNAIALTTIGSIIVKDGVGCYKYVTQSLNNDKIPEKKRKFVAALDLTNGVLMIAAQIGMFFAMKKLTEPLFNLLYKKTFNQKNIKEGIERIRMLQNKNNSKVSRKMNLEKDFAAVKKGALDVFKFVADIGAATILGKRVIVPLIATPLASKVQAKMEKHSTPTSENGNSDIKNQDSSVKPQNILDIQDSEETNLLDRYKKYYGPIQKD